MNLRDKEIKRLKRVVRKLQEENNFLKSPLYLYEVTEQIQDHYSVLLQPPPREFKTTKGQRSSVFQIDMNDIVCVISDGKSKWVYFNKMQESVRGERFVSDKLSFTGNLQSFCNVYDPPKIHLCIVSRSVAVNPSYYYLDANKLRLIGKKKSHSVCNEIVITPKHISNFIERKSALENIRSFQKIQFRSK